MLRNAATLGGNLCNASPAGDSLVPLLALGARVVLVSKPGAALEQRVLPLGEFLIGPGRTQRTPRELLAWVDLPLPPAGYRSEFLSFGTRPALDISTISLGVGRWSMPVAGTGAHRPRCGGADAASVPRPPRRHWRAGRSTRRQSLRRSTPSRPTSIPSATCALRSGTGANW